MNTTLARSASINIRIVHALLMREVLTRFGRHNIGFLWMFVEPMLFTLGVTALWTAIKSIHNSEIPIAAFALTGYSSVLLWRNMPSRTIGSIGPNLALMYHRNVRIIDIFLSRLVLEVAGATISFVTLGIIFVAVGLIDPPEDVLKILFAWILLTYFGLGLAILLGSLAEEYESVDKIWHPASYLLFPLSGAAFLVDALPQQAQQVVLALPMVHGVEYLREGFFGSQVTAHYDLGYMAIISSIILALGLAQTRKISKLVVPE